MRQTDCFHWLNMYALKNLMSDYEVICVKKNHCVHSKIGAILAYQVALCISQGEEPFSKRPLF